MVPKPGEWRRPLTAPGEGRSEVRAVSIQRVGSGGRVSLLWSPAIATHTCCRSARPSSSGDPPPGRAFLVLLAPVIRFSPPFLLAASSDRTHLLNACRHFGTATQSPVSLFRGWSLAPLSVSTGGLDGRVWGSQHQNPEGGLPRREQEPPGTSKAISYIFVSFVHTFIHVGY